MGPYPYRTAHHARYQLDNLTQEDRAHLVEIFLSDPQFESSTKILPKTGHYISQVGSKRVVWTKGDDGVPLILTVVDKPLPY
ncbi:MAG: hypothetical protein GC191_06485 [Azospirillum sp.]|nr:hypothetical protein [Azospirillum sp.]